VPPAASREIVLPGQTEVSEGVVVIVGDGRNAMLMVLLEAALVKAQAPDEIASSTSLGRRLQDCS